MGQSRGQHGRLRAFAGAAAIALCGLALTAGPARADAIGDFQGTWLDRALERQYELGSDVGMRNAPWLGTHNSFNSIAEMGLLLSPLDSNQLITPVDQLRLGMRSLELDVHKFITVGDGIGFRPVVCHGRGANEAHLGCTLEKPLRTVLREISGWLRAPANTDQVILLYLEDHMEDAAGYDAGAQVVRDEIGDLVYEPAQTGCTSLPLSLTRNQVRAAGKQVLIVSDCGPGAGWNQVAFDWGSHVESRPIGFGEFPDCGPDFTRSEYDTKLVRYFEDSTALSEATGSPDDGITPPTAAAMTRCGVDLLGLDQVTGPADPRLPAVIWSWAHNRPLPADSPGRTRCALNRAGPKQPHGRFFDQRCNRRHRPACLGKRGWFVPEGRVRWREGRMTCSALGLKLAVPRTGFEQQQLRLAMADAGARTAWLGYRRSRGEWRATG